jgi:uncharacterized protein YeaO (DUF488 family)
MDIRIKRIYAAPSSGVRVLIDAIWPRGIRKSDARLALWLKEAAPSTHLRRWFGHRPERWREFRAYARVGQETGGPRDPLRARTETARHTPLRGTRRRT